MKRILLFILYICSLSHVYADNFHRADSILTWIREGQGDSLVARFHPAVRATLPAAAINKIWLQLENQAGTFVSQGNWTADVRDTLTMEQCRLTFDREEVRFVLLTDKQNYIVGFHFNPITKSLVIPENEKADLPEAYEERDTVVVNGRMELPATFCMPANRGGRCPVVVIVHGLGPTDKDGTLGPNKPYRDVARSFAARGIATFRYDKRTFVYGPRTRDLGGMLTYDTEIVDDAVEAIVLVSKYTEVDPQKIYVLGHSLGGTLAPRVAMLSKIPVAGVISVASTARSMEDWLRSQFRYLAEIQGSSQEQADSLTQIIYNKMPASYRSFAKEYNPIGTARGLHVPMLFLQGGHDYQVTKADFELWQKGLSGCPDVHFEWFENCDHLLRNISEMAVPEIYMRPGRVAKEAIDAVVDFIHP